MCILKWCHTIYNILHLAFSPQRHFLSSTHVTIYTFKLIPFNCRRIFQHLNIPILPRYGLIEEYLGCLQCFVITSNASVIT